MAAKKVLKKDDFGAWADTWLKTAGCNTIHHDIEEKDGKITKFVSHQGIYKHGDTNRLRQQSYNLDLLDKDMKVIKTVSITTSDKDELVEVKELVGQPAPHCYHINQGNYGFGKFRIDEKSIKAFTEGLHKVKGSMNRKQIFNILYDMLQEGDISGAQLLDICLNNIPHETETNVLGDVFKFIIPSLIKKYLPSAKFLLFHEQICDAVFKMLSSKDLKDKSTRHMLLDAFITSCKNQKHLHMLINMFHGKDIVDD